MYTLGFTLSNWIKKLGYKISKIEVKLAQKFRSYDQAQDESNKKKHYEGTQTWIGLHPQALQTPYQDIFNALNFLTEEEVLTVVDIGAGYGRVGLVMNSLFPNAEFIGYEVLKKRQEEGNRMFEKLGFSNCIIKNENVLDAGFKLPKAQVYFMYDFSEIVDLCEILNELSDRLGKDNFYLITKGDRLDYLLARKYKEFWISNGFKTLGDLKIYSSVKDLSNK